MNNVYITTYDEISDRFPPYDVAFSQDRKNLTPGDLIILRTGINEPLGGLYFLMRVLEPVQHYSPEDFDKRPHEWHQDRNYTFRCSAEIVETAHRDLRKLYNNRLHELMLREFEHHAEFAQSHYICHKPVPDNVWEEFLRFYNFDWDKHLNPDDIIIQSPREDYIEGYLYINQYEYFPQLKFGRIKARTDDEFRKRHRNDYTRYYPDAPKLEWFKFVPNQVQYEHVCKYFLSEWNYNGSGGKEFFTIELDNMIKIVENACEMLDMGVIIK
jgi:hypothetical protein